MLLSCRILIIVTILLLGQVPASAFLGRMPLHMIWEKDNAIICCEIIDTKQLHNELIVQIKVAEAIQSHPRLKSITRYVQPILGSATPQLHNGDRVIVFLEWNGKEQSFRSGFTQHLQLPHTGKAFAQVLRKLPAVMSEKDKTKREAKLREWYIECLLNSETRLEGILGLHKEHRAALTDEQWNQFIDTFVAEQPPRQHAPIFTRMLHVRKSDELNAHLLKSLRLAHKPGWEDLTHTAFTLLPKRLGIEYGDSIGKQHSELREIRPWIWGSEDERIEDETQRLEWRDRYYLLQGAMYRDAWRQCIRERQERRTAQAWQIKQDLRLSGFVSIVREYTSQVKGEDRGVREEAVILRYGFVDSPDPFAELPIPVDNNPPDTPVEDHLEFELQYVYRYPQSDSNGDWQLWINHDLISDGTGAEALAIRRFDHKPTQKQIQEFRSDTVNHGRNR